MKELRDLPGRAVVSEEVVDSPYIWRTVYTRIVQCEESTTSFFTHAGTARNADDIPLNLRRRVGF